MGTLAAIGWLFALLLAVSSWLHRRDCDKAIASLISSRNAYRDQLEDLRVTIKSSVAVARQQMELAPKRPAILNSAAARSRNDRSNAPYFSAEKHIPNSDILKEQ